MQKNINTLEDCIEAVTGSVHELSVIGVSTDDQILLSLSRQIRRNVALTDRQAVLAIEKVLKFKDEFASHGVTNIDTIVNNTRLPLRSVDRSKSITIDSYKSKIDTAIKIRFPFNKKIMSHINEIANKLPNKNTDYYHEKGTHEHYIRLSEPTVEMVVDMFSKKNFFIEPELLDLYEEIQAVKRNPEQYVPGIFKDKIKNMPQLAVDMIENDLGKIDHKTRLIYRDRSIRYGISHYDYQIPGHSVAEKIAIRKTPEVLVSPTIEFSTLIESLVDLKRAPILVLINDMKKDAEKLTETRQFHEEFSKYFPNSEQSVLFRVDNVPNTYTVNDYIKENSLNNWVGINTKVVYITKSRLPNLLVSGEWKPITSVSMTSDTSNTQVKDFVKHTCDLIVYRDSYITSMGKVYNREKIDVIL